MLAKNIRFLSTTRFVEGGASINNYNNFNLANHVGDESNTVNSNRKLLVEHFNLPSMPLWLNQTHSNICITTQNYKNNNADAMVTTTKNAVCAVLTADCLPIFACNKAGTIAGVAHAGWRGITNGIIETFIKNFNPQNTLIYLGPAISQVAFTVGDEVYQQYINKDKNLGAAFIKNNNKYQLDIYLAATIVLNNLGVTQISGGDYCTYLQTDEYFSYRRDGEKSGRMAHLIWIE